jgi:phosphoglycerate dehydrogenase-like enzyme
MSDVHVLEYVRSHDAVWNLPSDAFAALARRFPSVRFSSPGDAAAAEGMLGDADVVLGWAVTPRNFERARRLRWVHVTAAGVGPMLFPGMVDSEVVLTNSRGLHAVSMAEHALAVVLSFVRKLHVARDEQHAGRWSQAKMWTTGPPFGELAGATLGIVGLGSVGSALAVRAMALGLRVLAVRRHPQSDPAPAHEQWGIERMPELLERSDWVVLCPPLTPETRGLIGAAELERMRPHAVLVNLGRGALVDEPALIAALARGVIAGAALDVFEHEPLPAESPLWSMPQVLVTPHISGLGPRYWERAMDLFADNLARYQEGRPLANQVDKRAGY